MAVLLQCHQVLEGVDTRVETGGNQAGEHTRDIGTVLRLIEQLVLALADKQLQGPLHQIVVEGRADD